MATISSALVRIVTMKIIDDFNRLSQDRKQDVVMRTVLVAGAVFCVSLLAVPISPVFILCAMPAVVVGVALVSFAILTDPARVPGQNIAREIRRLMDNPI